MPSSTALDDSYQTNSDYKIDDLFPILSQVLKYVLHLPKSMLIDLMKKSMSGITTADSSNLPDTGTLDITFLQLHSFTITNISIYILVK